MQTVTTVCVCDLCVRLCRYDFTDGDLSVSLAQLHEYLDTYEAPPYK